MSFAKIQLRLPEDLKAAAARQAEAAGGEPEPVLSPPLWRPGVGAQAESERYFAARGARTTPARARALLMRLGSAAEPRDDDQIVPGENDV